MVMPDRKPFGRQQRFHWWTTNPTYLPNSFEKRHTRIVLTFELKQRTGAACAAIQTPPRGPTVWQVRGFVVHSENVAAADGFRSGITSQSWDFTAVNLERMPLPAEIREFNQDIRECVKRGLPRNGHRGKPTTDSCGAMNSAGGTRRKLLQHQPSRARCLRRPYMPQEIVSRHWTEIRAGRDGAKVVWISKQKIDHPPGDFYEGERLRFIRALGHALKYTGKHVSRSDGERLAQLEVAFQGVRRVHTMACFYSRDLRCQEKCGNCDGRCELVCGHQGDHHCKYHGSGNRCPLCDGHLMFPRESGYARVFKISRKRPPRNWRRLVGKPRAIGFSWTEGAGGLNTPNEMVR